MLSNLAKVLTLIVLSLALTLPVSARHHRRHYYRNISGHLVHSPVRARSAPRGATARCNDGTYSFSEHHQGTCSHPGGVAECLN
jgi:hypothetical protein